MKYLAACAVVRDERPYVREWVTFHLAVGVQHVVLYDNRSTDGTADEVADLVSRRLVTVRPWTSRPFQRSAYEDAYRTLRGRFRWCAFLDADEFLLPSDPAERDVKNVLGDIEQARPDAAAVGVHWLIFGSSGHVSSPGGLVIEQYQNRGPDDFQANRHIKSIVRLDANPSWLTSHMIKADGPTVNELGETLPIPDKLAGLVRDRPPTHQRLRVNHYFVKSLDHWRHKTARGYDGADLRKFATDEKAKEMFDEYDRNEVHDPLAASYAPAVRAFGNLPRHPFLTGTVLSVRDRLVRAAPRR